MPHLEAVVAVKFVPLMVSVKAALPATAVVGLRLVIVGGGGLTVNVAPAEVPLTLLTVTLAVPVVAIRLAGMAAVNWVALMKVVARAVAPHEEVVVAVKFVPLMVSVKAAEPATSVVGFRLVMEGGELTDNAKAALEAPTKVVVSESDDKFEFEDGEGADVGAAVRREAIGEGFVPLMGGVRTAPPVDPIAGVTPVTAFGGADE